MSRRGAKCGTRHPGAAGGARDPLDRCLIDRQNRAYAGTGGVSRNNRRLGFVPAFLDSTSGDVVVSRFADGRPAPVHLLEGLPRAWLAPQGDPACGPRARPGVIAGFLCEGRFYTREEAAEAVRALEPAAGIAA